MGGTLLGHIGNIGVVLDRNNAVADVTIIVGEKKAWNTGLASRAWCGVVSQLFSTYDLRKITAGTMSANESMIRLMKRSGMQIESVRKRQFIWRADEVDLIQGAVFRKTP